MFSIITRITVSVLSAAMLLFASGTFAAQSEPPSVSQSYEGAENTLSKSYRRLLPLEGGSNFRDMGGYPTEDGHTVKRGVMFRSAAMTSLTEEDQQYLEQFGFEKIVDLRSSEELELYPNKWVGNTDIEYANHDYSIRKLVSQMRTEQGGFGSMEKLYQSIHEMLEPQLHIFFDALLQQETPVVVNCSAGQDRTGVTSALLLKVLGVPERIIYEDYLLSTDFRRPEHERGDVDLEEAADDNFFARMMLDHYGEDGPPDTANPLVTEQGVPFLYFTFRSIESEYGSVESYLKTEIGLNDENIQQLRQQYRI